MAAPAAVAAAAAILVGAIAGLNLQSNPSQTDSPIGTAASADPAAVVSTVAPRATPDPGASPTATPPEPSPVPLGVWTSPSDGDLVTNTLELSAVPLPGRPDIPVYEVTFNMTWEGLGYTVRACSATGPSSGTTWSCTAHPATFGAPPGDLTLSFDVMDNNGGTTQSPDGTRTVSLLPPVAPAGWTKPKVVDRTTCSTLAATIDEAGEYHAVAECDGSVRYSASRGDGSWASRTFSHPSRRLDLNPQIATEGDLMYVAFTRDAPTDGGCGDDGLRDVGVYYRQRQLPDGRWSAAKRIGEIADHLQSFRVVDGTLHATVVAADGLVYYETVGGATSNRNLIPGATGSTSLRVGGDGRARMAYESDEGLRYAVFDRSGFATTPIGSDSRDFAPALVLGAGNVASIVWTRAYHGLGCAEPGPFADDGTYFATNASGTWVSERITPGVGTASLTLDVATGRVHVVVSAWASGLDYYTKLPGGAWSLTNLSVEAVGSPVIRLDPATGALLVVYNRVHRESMPDGIYAITRP
jgi:hypothetical protein